MGIAKDPNTYQMSITDLNLVAMTADEIQKFVVGPTNNNINIPDELYSVVCECENESQQKEVYETLNAKGYKCHPLTL